MDVIRRAELKSPIAKSLYRFIQSHRDDHWQGHFLTLPSTLNLEETLPNFKKRDRIRFAIRRLIAAKMLTRASGFKKNAPNVVTLIRFKRRARPSVKPSHRAYPDFDGCLTAQHVVTYSNFGP